MTIQQYNLVVKLQQPAGDNTAIQRAGVRRDLPGAGEANSYSLIKVCCFSISPYDPGVQLLLFDSFTGMVASIEKYKFSVTWSSL